MGKKSGLKKKIAKGGLRKPAPRPEAGRFPVWILVLVAAAAILIYARSIPYEFVYDDEQQIVDNTWIRDGSHLGRFFTTHVWAFAGGKTPSNYYRPLHMVTYVIAYAVGGLKPYFFHIINILLHALCSVVVAWIGFRLSRSPACGGAAGLLFALHPIHSESVAWISGVTDPLCAAFYFPALYFYLKDSQEEGNRTAILLASGCFLGALFSKEMAFTFPVVAAWLDWCLHKKLRWSRYAIFAGLFAFYALMRVNALGAFFVSHLSFTLDPWSRIVSSVVLFANYVAKLFVPYGISAFHVFVPTTSVGDPHLVLSLLLLGGFAGAAWWLRRRRVLLFLFGYCVLTILPVLNLNGIGQSIFADRYLYIPTLGSCLLIPLLAQASVRLIPAKLSGLDSQAGATLLGIVLVVFSWQLWGEIGVWRNAPTLYHETMRRSPDSSVFAHNLGRYYINQGDLEQGREWERKALAASEKSFIPNLPNLAGIYGGLGTICLQQGKPNEALEYFQKAYKARPEEGAVLRNLATAYLDLKEYRNAMFFLQALVRSDPRNAIAYSDMAAVFLTVGQYDQAIANARRSLEINPGYANAWQNLAQSYLAKGMKEETRQALLGLKKTDPSKAAMVDAELKKLSFR